MGLRKSLKRLLKSNIGVSVNLFDLLSITQYEDLTFAVLNQEDHTKSLENSKEYVFETAEEAIDKFLELRDKRKLGYDYEKEQ